MNKALVFLAAGFAGFFLAGNSNRNLPAKLPMPQKRAETSSPIRTETSPPVAGKLKEGEIPKVLLETGYFNDLPPKLTEAEKKQILSERMYTTIFSHRAGTSLANTPRNRRIVKAIENLPVSTVTVVNGVVRVENLKDLIPIDLYDFFDFKKGN